MKSTPHLNVVIVESVGNYIEHTTALSALIPNTVLYRGQAKQRSLLPGIGVIVLLMRNLAVLP